jgi:hypothetical protein
MDQLTISFFMPQPLMKKGIDLLNTGIVVSWKEEKAVINGVPQMNNATQVFLSAWRYFSKYVIYQARLNHSF